jgi:hypothetical protein
MSNANQSTAIACFLHAAEDHVCPPRDICHCNRRSAGEWTATIEDMKGPRDGKAAKHIVCWYRNGQPADNLVFGKAKDAAAYLARQNYSKVPSLAHDLHRQPA